MVSRKESITIEQGATYYQTFSLTDKDGNPIDFSGYTCNGMIRKTYSSLTAVALTANLSNSTLFLGLDPETTITFEPGRFVYDVNITDTQGNISRILEGVATVTPGVTR